MTEHSDFYQRYTLLLEKLRASDNWQEHLPEVINFFSQNKRFVVLESPFAAATQAEIEANLAYARAACHDALVRFGEVPFASHIKYTQEGILDDTIPWERSLGIAAGLAEGLLAQKTVVYVDRGFSSGMLKGVELALKAGRPVELRTLKQWDENPIQQLGNAKRALVSAMGTLADGVTMLYRRP